MKKGDLYQFPKNLFEDTRIGVYMEKHWCDSNDGWLYNFYFPTSGNDYWYTETELCYTTKLKLEQ